MINPQLAQNIRFGYSIAYSFPHPVIDTDDAFHGHPEPLACPRGESIISLALYYFTKDRPDGEKSNQHSALWKHPQNKGIKSPDKNTFKV